MSELNIPESWASDSFSNLSEVITKGTTPTTNGYSFQASGIKFIKIENMTNGYIDVSSIDQFISEKAHEAQKRSALEVGDILYSIAGSIGKTCLVTEDVPPANCNQAVAIIKGTNKVFDPLFLQYQLKSAKVYEAANKIKRGGALKNISLGDISSFQLVVPPLDEQRRIVQKIESCFSKIEETEQNLNRVEILLEKLSISFLMNSGDWLETTRLEDLTEERVERIKQKNPNCRKIGVDNELGVTDLRITGKQNFENYKIVRKGDIIYNPMRINVGSLALYNDTEEAITSPDYIVFSVRAGFSKWLIFKFLKSVHGADEISKKLTGSVRERLYYKKLKEIPFPCPTKDIHQKAEIVIETINNQILSQKLRFTGLFTKLKDSILQKAFEGSLVEQIDSEGTGHELLQKILAQKSSKEVATNETIKKKVARKASKKKTTKK